MHGEALVNVEVDYRDAYSFHNYIDRLKLACAPKTSIGMLGSAYFTGWAIASIFITGLSDTYGRKKTYLVSMLV